ncbi:DUF4240 domain-containing protein [Streptomyces sp. SID4919]|uniref:DUF4240 domain-containing protein n=1 Tax=unclassified Streptomyces TaxID=2593676 RepID=UPI0008239035|nr:DUF4240 domain-containing protein [Streptomyces sp. SID4919]SCK22255.1 Protein of unknown function [Streptomyces sp. AmelKG-E11A]
MDKTEFWDLVGRARAEVAARAVPAAGSGSGAGSGGSGSQGAGERGGAGRPDTRAVADRVAELLAERPAEHISAAQQVLWDLMAESYRAPLWAAAYTVNGGCSDDGFDYFRAWLIGQGREVFERVVADPDALAGLDAVREVAGSWAELECERVLGVAWDAHRAATGEELPPTWSVSYAPLDPDWSFDFDDEREIARRLPALAALFFDDKPDETDGSDKPDGTDETDERGGTAEGDGTGDAAGRTDDRAGTGAAPEEDGGAR